MSPCKRCTFSHCLDLLTLKIIKTKTHLNSNVCSFWFPWHSIMMSIHWKRMLKYMFLTIKHWCRLCVLGCVFLYHGIKHKYPCNQCILLIYLSDYLLKWYISMGLCTMCFCCVVNALCCRCRQTGSFPLSSIYWNQLVKNHHLIIPIMLGIQWLFSRFSAVLLLYVTGKLLSIYTLHHCRTPTEAVHDGGLRKWLPA